MEMQPGFTLWMTGMSGAGKSTLARYIASRLPLIGRRVELLDGPDVEALFPEVPRASNRERLEHATRALGWAARLLTRNGVISIVTSLSPYRDSREEVRRGIGRFVEVMVDAPWEKLVERDPRGLYKQIEKGEITDIIGYHEPYETNSHPEIKVDTGGEESVEDLGRFVFERLFGHGFLSRRERDVLINGGTLEPDEEEVETIDAEEAREEVIARAEAAAQAAAATTVVLKRPAPAAETAQARPAKAAKPAKEPARAAKAAEAPAAVAEAAAPAAKKPAAKPARTASAAKPAKAPEAVAAPKATKAAKAPKVADKAPKAAAKPPRATPAAKAAKAPKAAAKVAKAPAKAPAKAAAKAPRKAPAAKTPAKAPAASRPAAKAKAAPKTARPVVAARKAAPARQAAARR